MPEKGRLLNNESDWSFWVTLSPTLIVEHIVHKRFEGKRVSDKHHTLQDRTMGDFGMLKPWRSVWDKLYQIFYPLLFPTTVIYVRECFRRRLSEPIYLDQGMNAASSLWRRIIKSLLI